jgi:lipopolysaccharide export system protein LptC
MKLRTQSLFPIGILTLLAGLTFWLEHVTQVETPRDDGKTRHDPDYIAENFTVRRFGPQGGLQNTLAAQKMVHYPDDDTTLVSEPRVSTFGGLRPSHLSAREALVGPDGREVVLIREVRGRREATAKDPELVFATSTLTAFPDDEVVRTAAPVVITQGASVIRGTGLEADNRTAIYKLLGQVTSTIERRRR